MLNRGSALTVEGQKLRDLRKKNDLSQAEIANLTGSHQTRISSIENGHEKLSSENREAIKHSFGIEISDDDSEIPAWLQRLEFKLRSTYRDLPEHAVKQLEERVQSLLSVYADPDIPQGYPEDMHFNWGFFTSDACAYMERHLAGILKFTSITITRFMDAWDEYSRFTIGGVGRTPSTRTSINKLTPENYRKSFMLLASGTLSDQDHLPPQVIFIPIVLKDSRVVILEIVGTSREDYKEIDAELVSTLFKSYLERRDVAYLEGKELDKFLSNRFTISGIMMEIPS